MKNLAGVLCCVFFLSSSAAYLVDTPKVQPNCQREVSENHAVLIGGARADWTKAVRVEIVTMQGCGPCLLLKQTTIPSLEKAGYAVKVVDRYDDTRGTAAFPTIYYFGALGQLTHMDVGYRTYVQVIRHLEKP